MSPKSDRKPRLWRFSEPRSPLCTRPRCPRVPRLSSFDVVTRQLLESGGAVCTTDSDSLSIGLYQLPAV